MEKPIEMPPTPLTPQQQKLNQLLIGLMNAATILVVKVAACTCKQKEECGVYRKAKEIAKTIDEIQELREKMPEITQAGA